MHLDDFDDFFQGALDFAVDYGFSDIKDKIKIGYDHDKEKAFVRHINASLSENGKAYKASKPIIIIYFAHMTETEIQIVINEEVKRMIHSIAESLPGPTTSE